MEELFLIYTIAKEGLPEVMISVNMFDVDSKHICFTYICLEYILLLLLKYRIILFKEINKKPRIR